MTDQKICGFSMGAPELRKCIEGDCMFWKDTEIEIKRLSEEMTDEGLDQQSIEDEMAEIREVLGKGFCIFESQGIS